MSKFKKGDTIKSMDNLVKQEFIFMGNKVYHAGFFMSWPLRSALTWLKAGKFNYAIDKSKEEAST